MSESSRAGGAAALALLLSFYSVHALGSLPGEGEAAPAKARKVLIIGIDGLRADALLAADAPRLHALAREGAFTAEAMADRVTHSGPGWTAILTGAWSPRNGVIDNTFDGYHRDAHPHFFRRVKEAMPSAYTASIVNWEPIHSRLVTHADLSIAYGDDDSVAARAVRLLREGDPDAVFLHFDAPDHAGHRSGFSRFSPPYLHAIGRADRLVGEVLEALAARPGRTSEEWLILGATDHGGVFRHHGEDDPACRLVPLIVAGDGAMAGSKLPGAGIADVAPTALAWLGVEIRKGWGMDGRPIGLRRMPDEEPRAGPAEPWPRTGRIRPGRAAEDGAPPEGGSPHEEEEAALGGIVGERRAVGQGGSGGAGGRLTGQAPYLPDQ
jgi:arylsulfatase A-like enzyme